MNEQARFEDLGPLEPLLEDEHVLEIMVNGADSIYVERHGKLEEAPQKFRDNRHVMEIIERILTPLGRKVDESSPICDVRLPDLSRVHIVVPPVAVKGPTMVIRKMFQKPLTLEQLLEWGCLSEPMAIFIKACVQARLNMAILGGTGSGKTTLLNIIAGMIPEQERIITVEESSSIQLRHRHVVSLESRAADAEGRGEITMKHLMDSAMKMRPDRIIVGEVRGAEVLLLLQAMNTGYDGSMLTLHATSPRDALSRIEVMALHADPALPLLVIREHMASSLDVLIQNDLMVDRRRRVVKVTEVVGMQGDAVGTQDIFEFVQTGIRDGNIEGHFSPTGRVPQFVNRFAAAGVELPAEMFRV